MFFSVLLYVSLTIFGLGILIKMFGWLSKDVGIAGKDTTVSGRFAAMIKGILAVLLSPRLFSLIKVFLLDVVLQRKILQESGLRWAMHMLIYGGFFLLLFMHALGSIITQAIFADYYSTVNPFFFLRDLFGVMAIAGIALAIYRRFVAKVPRLFTNSMDIYAIVIVAVILVSGLALEAVKITSQTVFDDMVENYAGLDPDDDEEEISALLAYWVKDYGVVADGIKGPFDPELLETGQESHDNYCASCHAPTGYAFAGFTLSKIISPVATLLDKANAPVILWWVHILACLIGLAYLPFSKMFHIITTPLALLANGVMNGNSNPANIATRQAMELDACTHCGTCSLNCSAQMAYYTRENACILPSEKIGFLKKSSGKTLSKKDLANIAEGVVLCTSCDRCTVVCPSGINLREMWMGVKERLLAQQCPDPLVLSPYSFARGINKDSLPQAGYDNPQKAAQKAVAGDFAAIMAPDQPLALGAPDETGGLVDPTFAYCFGCQNCTSVCPVAGAYDEPQKELGLLPHQIMLSLAFGLTELAAGAKMVWDCTTCYQCQEHCPQKVAVTDILYSLKNVSAARAKDGDCADCKGKVA